MKSPDEGMLKMLFWRTRQRSLRVSGGSDGGKRYEIRVASLGGDSEYVVWKVSRVKNRMQSGLAIESSITDSKSLGIMGSRKYPTQILTRVWANSHL